MNWQELEFINHDIYWEIAKEHLDLSLAIDRELSEKFGVTSFNYPGINIKTEGSWDDLFFLYEKITNAKKHNVISIVFTALTAESFINFYAKTNGKDDAYLRQFRGSNGLSETVIKWIYIPHAIKNSYAFTESSQEALDLQKLFDARNKLAHHKAFIVNVQDINWNDINSLSDPNDVTTEDVQKGQEALFRALSALKNIDSTIDLNWLNKHLH
jgi:hypothetical protein